ncbi:MULTISPECIES: c-type cytochrome [Ectothiorhodospira]|uniref:Cytochrome subunit of sulfide dehydrogenase n=1 Tax=Ectothiorhodospira marina TaxID=1396821 RepID=A0A1H7K0L5_9GAMM|nr:MULTISPECIES: cytochrome c [Ectothiorhodospira]MCG5516164.1 cytochrome c [Ectothiorhodospira sp. 9100]MCG5519608.1 cytochrome c [Ectothiorhodospira sp. 9905]SEK79507.1 cytochrome subunit of sulfide dehydrogenase [Ectothiorhodospira marina]
MIRKHITVATLALAAIGAVAVAQAEVTRGELMANTCFACHGTDGHSAGSIPSIYGYPPEILVGQMKAFREGRRPATVMDRHATGYSDEEIELIAEYLSRQ